MERQCVVKGQLVYSQPTGGCIHNTTSGKQRCLEDFSAPSDCYHSRSEAQDRLEFSAEAKIMVRHCRMHEIPAPAEIIAQQEDAEIHPRTQTKTTLDTK